MQKLLTKLRSVWESAQTSLWFIPSLLVASAILLSFLLLFVDETYTEYINEHMTWLFSGTPSSAQQILTTIAGAVITVVSISFSLTIIAMQQASVQYSPRVLRNFTSDKGSQLVLGFYIATFTYSLLILRAIRTSEFEGGGFVPSIALGVAVLFSLICMGLLVYFIDHIATLLQASTITSHIHQELLRQIDELYPERIGKAPKNASKRASKKRKGQTYVIHSKTSGYITRIDEQSLRNIDFHGATDLHILPQIGNFVFHGEPIAHLVMPKQLSEELASNVQGIIAITKRRSVHQDPLFAIRQLVDAALKGLSPGVNDITTSNYCIRYLGDALGVLAKRDFPSKKQFVPEINLMIHFERPTWEEFVDRSFNEILHSAKDNTHVLNELLGVLLQLARQLPSKRHAPPVQALLNDIKLLSKEYLILPSDKKRTADNIRAVRKALVSTPTTQ